MNKIICHVHYSHLTLNDNSIAPSAQTRYRFFFVFFFFFGGGGRYANMADPVQTPQYAASDHGLHSLRTMQNTVKVKLFTRNP